MGKVRKMVMGDESLEEEQKKRAEARRQTKQAKKKGDGKTGERTAVVEGTDIKPEFKKLIEKVEKEEKIPDSEEKKSKGKGKKKKNADEAQVKTRSKRYLEIVKLVDAKKMYSLKEAVALVKKTSLTKFDGTVEIHINLNPATLGEKKDIRGQVSLPHGTGKKINVVVASDAILAEIEAGKITFDILVAHPSMMPKLAKFARTLGPKGLMPNPKNGTVTADVEKRVKELSQGQINYKTEPDNPIIHMAVGKVSFTDKQLEENISAIFTSVGKGKIARATLTSTMGPGIKLAVS